MDRKPVDPQDIVTRIVEALAEAEGVRPEELPFRLAEHVDVDALAGITARSDAPLRIEFAVDDHRVSVESADAITVELIERGPMDPTDTPNSPPNRLAEVRKQLRLVIETLGAEHPQADRLSNAVDIVDDVADQLADD